MSAPRLWPGRWWMVAFALGFVLTVLSWAVSGSSISAFLAGANGVFLMWAITDHLEAKLEKLNTELARLRMIQVRR